MQVTYHGDRRQYYEYDGVYYTATFPALWAETHAPGTGPRECKLCNEVGYWNGVFIGYCWNCAHQYNYTRGYGFEDGIEASLHIIENSYHYTKQEGQISAADSYLYGISLDEIGDTDYVDSRLLLEEDFKQQTEEHFQNSNCDCATNPYCVYRCNFLDEPASDERLKEDSAWDDSDWDDDNWDDAISYGYGSNYNGGYNSY